MTSETEPISPQALRIAREEARLSQRELGRRVAVRLGRADGARAIQVRLSRIEKGDDISQEERELLDALATELAVGVDDLAEAYKWVWITVRDGVPGIVELAMRFPSYSTPELAYQARDHLAHASNGHFKPFRNAQLVPMRVATLEGDVLDENHPDLTADERELLIAVDPDEDVLPYLAALDEVVNAANPEDWNFIAIVDTIEMFNLVVEVERLHDLALRRLAHAPENNPEILVAWRRREERLFMILEIRHLRRLQERERKLADVPPDG